MGGEAAVFGAALAGTVMQTESDILVAAFDSWEGVPFGGEVEGMEHLGRGQLVQNSSPL